MGVTKQQLLNTVTQVKTYVDTEIDKIEVSGETTYSDQEIKQAVDTILGTTTE